MRRLIVANWKMNKSPSEAVAFAGDFLASREKDIHAHDRPEVAFAPPYTALAGLQTALAGALAGLAAQDVSAHPQGAFTGEIAAEMLADLGCRYCLVGHSERRALWQETSEIVAKKATRLCENEIIPILCVGETREEREAERTSDIVLEMIRSSLPPAGIPGRDSLVVAYEPVWAIGTGLTATPEQAQEVHTLIRHCLIEEMGDAGQEIRILYGGSVNPENARAILTRNEIDGVLVGGASLDPVDFTKIVEYEDLEDVPT
jgi:triosephosphate isomerase